MRSFNVVAHFDVRPAFWERFYTGGWPELERSLGTSFVWTRSATPQPLEVKLAFTVKLPEAAPGVPVVSPARWRWASLFTLTEAEIAVRVCSVEPVWTDVELFVIGTSESSAPSSPRL